MPKVDAAQVAQSRPTRGATGTWASNKLEARRLQMLATQREHLEEEMEALEAEVKQLVRIIRPLPSTLNTTLETSPGAESDEIIMPSLIHLF